MCSTCCSSVLKHGVHTPTFRQSHKHTPDAVEAHSCVKLIAKFSLDELRTVYTTGKGQLLTGVCVSDEAHDRILAINLELTWQCTRLSKQHLYHQHSMPHIFKNCSMSMLQ